MKKLLNSLKREGYCIRIILKEKRVVLGKIDSRKIAIFIDEDNIEKGEKLELNDMIQKNEIRVFRLSKEEVKGLQYV